jgi:hypothetical protein
MTAKTSPIQTPSNTTTMEYLCSSPVRFALFVKILMKHLKAVGENDLLKKTRILIAESISRYRMMGDLRCSSSPLADAIALQLLELVGPDYWVRAEGLLHFYIARKEGANQRPRLPQRTAVSSLSSNDRLV